MSFSLFLKICVMTLVFTNIRAQSIFNAWSLGTLSAFVNRHLCFYKEPLFLWYIFSHFLITVLPFPQLEPCLSVPVRFIMLLYYLAVKDNCSPSSQNYEIFGDLIHRIFICVTIRLNFKPCVELFSKQLVCIFTIILFMFLVIIT